MYNDIYKNKLYLKVEYRLYLNKIIPYYINRLKCLIEVSQKKRIIFCNYKFQNIFTHISVFFFFLYINNIVISSDYSFLRFNIDHTFLKPYNAYIPLTFKLFFC